MASGLMPALIQGSDGNFYGMTLKGYSASLMAFLQQFLWHRLPCNTRRRIHHSDRVQRFR